VGEGPSEKDAWSSASVDALAMERGACVLFPCAPSQAGRSRLAGL
jgi:hypothetical protein